MVFGVEMARLSGRLYHGTGETVMSCKGKGTREDLSRLIVPMGIAVADYGVVVKKSL